MSLLVATHIGIVLCSILLLMLKNALLVVTVYKSSMMPSLEPGDKVLVLKLYPKCWLRRGQIVILSEPSQSEVNALKLYVKRITGLSGDPISIKTVPATVHYFLGSTFSAAETDKNSFVPVNHVFVQGDSQFSFDSRQWGPIPKSCIVGVAILKLPRYE